MRNTLHIGSIQTSEDYQTVRELFAKEITEPSNVAFPDFPIQRSSGLYSEILGAWINHRLVGAIFISPGHQYGEDEHFPKELRKHAQRLTQSIAVIQALAVDPAHRRKGIATRLKLAATLWAEEHGAQTVLSIPTNTAARKLNTQCGYIVLPPDVTLVFNHEDTGINFAFPIENSSTWAIYPITQPGLPPLAIGYINPITATQGTHHHITWLN